MTDEGCYLYKIQPIRPDMLAMGATPGEDAIIGEHFSYLSDLTTKGIVLLAGRTLNSDPSSFGIVILKAASENTARAVMLADPAVIKGVMRAELFPFRIALCSDQIRNPWVEGIEKPDRAFLCDSWYLLDGYVLIYKGNKR